MDGPQRSTQEKRDGTCLQISGVCLPPETRRVNVTQHMLCSGLKFNFTGNHHPLCEEVGVAMVTGWWRAVMKPPAHGFCRLRLSPCLLFSNGWHHIWKGTNGSGWDSGLSITTALFNRILCYMIPDIELNLLNEHGGLKKTWDWDGCLQCLLILKSHFVKDFYTIRLKSVPAAQ